MRVRTSRIFQSASVMTVLCFIALWAVKKPSGNVHAYLQEPAMPLKLMFAADNLDAATYQLYESVRSNINGYANIPIARTNYYSTVNNVNGYELNGWGGIITSIQPNALGYLVTIDVQPELSSDWAASAIIVDSGYAEIYQVYADGTFAYLNSLDPNNQSGQTHTVVGL